MPLLEPPQKNRSAPSDSTPDRATPLGISSLSITLLVPLVFSAGWRAEYRRLDRKTWAWMIALALTGGSVPFALFFSGLQLTTAATGALVNHFQFVLVALFAAVFLGERLRATVWAGMIILLIATVVGTSLDTLRWNTGSVLIAMSTVLFAIENRDLFGTRNIHENSFSGLLELK